MAATSGNQPANFILLLNKLKYFPDQPNLLLAIMKEDYFHPDNVDTSLDEMAALLEDHQLIELTAGARDRINRCREYLDHRLDNSDELHYGVNTGFGFLQNVRIDKKNLEELQMNLLLSHACGMGEEVPADIVRLMMVLKIKSLSYGFSGISVQTVDRLVDMVNQDILPLVYTQGSLGASGDLATLSHLSLPLCGLGEVLYKGTKAPAGKVLQKLGWAPLRLQSKEGLALINGTQFMSAYGIYNLIRCRRLLSWADLIACIGYEAFDCSIAPLHEKIHSIRQHPGQIETASVMRRLLQGSEISAGRKTQVQDPYSFRCVPQVHGASRDSFDHVVSVFIREINSVTDNPNIFPDEDLIVSGGNFHGQPLAIGFDLLAIAMSEIGSIAERRTFQLISGQRGLPVFLIRNPGLQSGLMIPQYTAAGLASENKQLCTPASVDSIPSSNNQEDHVSMGANAAIKCKRVVDNVEKILAIELLTAVQAMEYRRPLRSSVVLEEVVSEFRKLVSFNDADRILRNDILKAIDFIGRDPATRFDN